MTDRRRTYCPSPRCSHATHLAHQPHEVPVLPRARAVDGCVAHQLRVHLHRGVEPDGAFLGDTRHVTRKNKQNTTKKWRSGCRGPYAGRSFSVSRPDSRSPTQKKRRHHQTPLAPRSGTVPRSHLLGKSPPLGIIDSRSGFGNFTGIIPVVKQMHPDVHLAILQPLALCGAHFDALLTPQHLFTDGDNNRGRCVPGLSFNLNVLWPWRGRKRNTEKREINRMRYIDR